MRACLVYIKIIPQQIFIAEFRELSKGQKISVSPEKKYFTSWWQPIVYHEKLQAFCTWWKLCRHFEFCEVMFGLRKKNLKEKSFLWCLRKLVRLCAEDVGHIIYYILSCYKFICQLHQVYMHAYLNLRSNMAVMACSLRSNITLRKLSFQGLFY